MTAGFEPSTMSNPHFCRPRRMFRSGSKHLPSQGLMSLQTRTKCQFAASPVYNPGRALFAEPTNPENPFKPYNSSTPTEQCTPETLHPEP